MSRTQLAGMILAGVLGWLAVFFGAAWVTVRCVDRHRVSLDDELD
jgi:hypothetical protein